MSNKFPLRYMIMSLKNNEQIYAYIIVKCYLISEIKKYNYIDGTTVKNYEVVIAWNYETKENINPIFDENDNCQNSIILSNEHIYNTLKEAIEKSEFLNNNLNYRYITKQDLDEILEIQGLTNKKVKSIKK